MNRKETTPDPAENTIKYRRIQEKINEVKMMCRTNFSAKWELAFLPYSGGYYEQPADEMEKIEEIIRAVNIAIQRKQDKESD